MGVIVPWQIQSDKPRFCHEHAWVSIREFLHALQAEKWRGKRTGSENRINLALTSSGLQRTRTRIKIAFRSKTLAKFFVFCARLLILTRFTDLNSFQIATNLASKIGLATPPPNPNLSGSGPTLVLNATLPGPSFFLVAGLYFPSERAALMFRINLVFPTYPHLGLERINLVIPKNDVYPVNSR
jgi:hypothetical protein